MKEKTPLAGVISFSEIFNYLLPEETDSAFSKTEPDILSEEADAHRLTKSPGSAITGG